MTNSTLLGIDIGASKINAVLIQKNKIIKKIKSTNITAKSLKNIINSFNTQKIGLGIPGITDPSKNIILHCPSAPQLNNLNLKELTDKKIKIDNDVNCLLRAESALGSIQGYKNALALAFGTGIGGSIMLNGTIYNGSTNSAGEFGWIILENNKAWETLYQQSKNNLKLQLKINSQGIGNLINIFDPEIIVIGGGAKITMPKMKDIAKYINSPLAKKVKIVRAKFGANSQAIGAALLFK